jgi:HlyD family secretion protein
MKTLLITLALASAVGGAAYLKYGRASEAAGPSFRTAKVERDELLVVINATGTVEPEEVVDVGAQVAGRIIEFGKEAGETATIDYRSAVQPGTILARIDDVLYREEVNVAKAQVAKAKAFAEQTKTKLAEGEAGVERAQADLQQTKARLAQAERDWGRAQKLKETNVVAQQEYDTYLAAYETAKAAVAVSEAAILQARSVVKTAQAAIDEGQADVDSAQATLNRAERNLDYTTIRSPIAGVIIDRRVNIGQTVVASLNAPSLFLIAKDLRRIQVWASVNEADIGRIRQGQAVTFTVDTYPGEVFTGAVGQIRLNATMTQNVVTYTVVVNADNSKEKLLPYLTANLKFEVARRPDALLVPNAALRWRPRPDLVAPEHRNSAEASAKNRSKDGAPLDRGVVWIAEGSHVRPVAVKIGFNDDAQTEILSGELTEGAGVVVGEQLGGGDSGVVNPLAPRVYSGGKSQGG